MHIYTHIHIHTHTLNQPTKQPIPVHFEALSGKRGVGRSEKALMPEGRKAWLNLDACGDPEASSQSPTAYLAVTPFSGASFRVEASSPSGEANLPGLLRGRRCCFRPGARPNSPPQPGKKPPPLPSPTAHATPRRLASPRARAAPSRLSSGRSLGAAPATPPSRPAIGGNLAFGARLPFGAVQV